jgi:hypothetical protein
MPVGARESSVTEYDAMPMGGGLEQALTDLGAHLDHPRPADLPARVAAAIRVEAPAPGRPRARRRVALAVAAVAVVGGIAVAPAVADWFSPRGTEILREPAPEPPSAGAPLALGRAVTVDAARDAAGFDVGLPRELGAPDGVWLGEAGGVPVVSLVYEPRPGLPEAGTTGVGALVVEFGGELDEQVVISKFVDKNTRIEPVEVGGERGLWIDGIHAVGYVPGGGDMVPDELRLADRVLLWERGDVTLRIETALGRDAALRLAESVE